VNSSRIGFNAAFYSPLKVGINSFIRNLASGLAREWQLVIYTSCPDDFATLGAEVRVVPNWTRKFYFRLPWNYHALPGLVRRDRLDLLLSPVPELPLSLPIPAIAVIHDLTPLVLPGSSRWHHTVLFRHSVQRLGAATCLVADSENTRKDVQQMLPWREKPGHVIYVGTDFPSEAGDVNPVCAAGVPSEPFLLYVGGFLPHKNVSLLISVFYALSREIPHRLVLVGWGPERIMGPLRMAIADLGIQDRVSLLQGIPESELKNLYRRCDLFVYPSRYEGFGLPVLEAMACGAPVLCSNAASLPEVGGDAVKYFSPLDGPEFVSSVRSLLAHPEQRRQMAAAGRERARIFTWERTTRQYSQLIQQTLARA
jgi:glycosyltransferase involved in cell wall biosynthesis